MKTVEQNNNCKRIQELCDQDTNSANAFSGEGKDAILRRSTLTFMGMLFAAYESENGDICVAVHDGDKWNGTKNISAGYPRRENESWTMPKLAEGPDGVVWLFYMSRERRMLFCHRYLGSEWSRRIDLPGIHHVMPYFDGSFGEDRAPLSAFSVEPDKVDRRRSRARP